MKQLSKNVNLFIKRRRMSIKTFASSSFQIPLCRAPWTATFSLSFVQHLCLGVTTVSFLWLKLSTFLMYFSVWLLFFLAHWAWKSAKSANGFSNFIASRPKYRALLLQHLIEDPAEEWTLVTQEGVLATGALPSDSSSAANTGDRSSAVDPDYLMIGVHVQEPDAVNTDSNRISKSTNEECLQNRSNSGSAAALLCESRIGRAEGPDFETVASVVTDDNSDETSFTSTTSSGYVPPQLRLLRSSSREQQGHLGSMVSLADSAITMTSATTSSASDQNPAVTVGTSRRSHFKLPRRLPREKAQILLRKFAGKLRFLRALQLLMIFSYESLVEQALQLVNCVGVGACGRVLAQYPEVSCPDNPDYIPLLVVAVLILIWAILFPVVLFFYLRKLPRGGRRIRTGKPGNGSSTRQSGAEGAEPSESSASGALPEPKEASLEMRLYLRAKYGVFYDQYKPEFWWWEIQVSWKCIKLENNKVK